MARAPRSETFDEDETGIFHVVNRCVRRCFLCGVDHYSGRSFDHRREWVRQRLVFLASIYAIDFLNYAILGNHLHVLVRNRPQIRDLWSDEEVVRRWWRLFPRRRDENGEPAELTAEELQARLSDPEKVNRRPACRWNARCDRGLSGRPSRRRGRRAARLGRSGR